MRIRIWNNQVWALAHGNWAHAPRHQDAFSPEALLDFALEHLETFSHIGLAETFQTDRDIIYSSLGIVPPENNADVTVTPGRPHAKDLPAETLELLAGLTRLDQQLYESVLSKQTLR